MPILKPYPHVYRHGPDNINRPFIENGRTPVGKHYLQSFEILKRDLQRLLEYIEPTTDNYLTYSHRTYELFLRACTEVETNFKQIFHANDLDFKEANIIRYSDLNGVMKLNEYVVTCPAIQIDEFCPFSSFTHQQRGDRSPSWYRDYNNAKHDRATNFTCAHLRNVIESIGAAFVLLSAQYGYHFDGGVGAIMGISTGPPKYFGLRSHPTWTPDESYQFDWDILLNSGEEPYIKLDI